MFEVDEAARIITEAADPEANIILVPLSTTPTLEKSRSLWLPLVLMM